MSSISRRQTLGAAVAAAATFGAPSVHAQKGRSILRFVAEADLNVLDPIWQTAYITRDHGYLVYDTLFGTDETHRIKPQVVESTTVSDDGMTYTFTLREGLRWHHRQPVQSGDRVESLKRWGKRDRFGRLLMAHTGKIAPVEDLHPRIGPALRSRARGAGEPVQQRAVMMPHGSRSRPRRSRSPRSWARARSSS